MADFNTNNSNLANTFRGLNIFSGRVPLEVKDGPKQSCLMLSINCRAVCAIIQGQLRPTTATGWSTATTSRYLAEQEEAYDRTSHDLYAILFVATLKLASLLVLKHEDATRASDDGRKAWEGVQKKYLRLPTVTYASRQYN